MATAKLKGCLCTRDDLRERCNIEDSDTQYDALMDSIIRGVSGKFDIETNRTLLLNASDVTETFKGGLGVIIVPRFPIVSVTSVTESLDYDWASETALTADDDYRVVKKTGSIYRLHCTFLSGPDVVQIVYKGGYVGPEDTATTSQTALPDEIREAAIQQAQFIFQRREAVGLTSTSSPGLSVSTYSGSDMMPQVKSVLRKYRRYA
jgi:hypothetical protein